MKVRGPCIHQGKTFWAEVAASYSASPDPTLPSVWSHFPLAPCFDTLPTPSSSTMTRLPPTTSPPQIATSLGGSSSSPQPVTQHLLQCAHQVPSSPSPSTPTRINCSPSCTSSLITPSLTSQSVVSPPGLEDWYCFFLSPVRVLRAAL